MSNNIQLSSRKVINFILQLYAEIILCAIAAAVVIKTKRFNGKTSYQ